MRTIGRLIGKIALVLLAATLIGNNVYAYNWERDEPLVAEHDKEDKVLRVVVHVVEDDQELYNSFDFWYPDDTPPEELHGFTVRVFSGREIGEVCHVYVQEVDRYADPEFMVWGHELAHCVYGWWHK